ncbi:MAG: endonuclease/exonuclease/phosphatase family protein [Kiritimatiellaeota bacterium]|nr:endonuclease/exonuclease/phosphatase family protein [Kiritimatiellota bacterium]
MRLLLYNIRYGAGVGRGFHFPIPYQGYLKRTQKNLQRITQFIKSQQPDIVGLVEADAGSYRTQRQNQVETIAQALGHYHVYQSKYSRYSRMRRLPMLNKQVNALLTKDVIEAQRFHYFRSGVKRLVIEVELKDLLIFLVHLSIRHKTRHEQLRALMRLLDATRKPVLVAGDFNVFRGPQELEPLLAHAGLCRAHNSLLATYPSWAPRRQLDFILHSPDIRVTKFAVPDMTLSDHLPLVCDFDIHPVPGKARRTG